MWESMRSCSSARSRSTERGAAGEGSDKPVVRGFTVVLECIVVVIECILVSLVRHRARGVPPYQSTCT